MKTRILTTSVLGTVPVFILKAFASAWGPGATGEDATQQPFPTAIGSRPR
jgi:hypothetical protein